VALDATSWQRELPKHLPRGVTLDSAGLVPDIDDMRVEAPARRAGKAGAEMAEIELGLVNERFTIKRVKLAPKTK
jgi:hypothetical protein